MNEWTLQFTGLGLHSLVLTIAMAGVYKGVNLVLTKGVAITNIPESTVFLGRGDIGPLRRRPLAEFVNLDRWDEPAEDLTAAT